MTRLSHHDAIIFDLDGTLIDSAPSLHRAACEMLGRLSLPQPDLATVTGFVGNGVPKLVDRCLTWAGRDVDPGAVDLFREIYDADPVNGVTVFPGVRALLEDLRAEGRLVALCTNKPLAPTKTLVAALDLGPFDAIVGGDSLPVRKPDPAPLLHAVNDLGPHATAPLYVGDSAVDLATALAANVPYAHLDWGYANGQLEPLSDDRRFDDIGALARALKAA